MDLSLQRRMRLHGTAVLASTASLTQTMALPKQCPVSGSSQCLRYDFVYAYLWSVTIRIASWNKSTILSLAIIYPNCGATMFTLILRAGQHKLTVDTVFALAI